MELDEEELPNVVVHTNVTKKLVNEVYALLDKKMNSIIASIAGRANNNIPFHVSVYSHLGKNSIEDWLHKGIALIRCELSGDWNTSLHVGEFC